MRMRAATAAIGLLLIASGCHYQSPATIHGAKTPAEDRGPDRVARAVSVIGGLAGPESVLYDPDQDVYFISNINGGLLAKDNNGFIARVRAGTMQVEMKWIAGGVKGVRLDAPKGMAIAGDVLYVSDVSAVRKFDRRTGEARGEIALPGATLINDLTTDGTNVYASDTGIKPAAGITFGPTKTDAIWKISGDRASKIASGPELDQPNGLDYYDGALWVVSFGGDELYRLDGAKKADVVRYPRGQLDGIIHLADGTPVVTSWIGQAVYRGRGRDAVAVLRGIAAPADIGYDARRHLLLLPNSPANTVTTHVLQ